MKIITLSACAAALAVVGCSDGASDDAGEQGAAVQADGRSLASAPVVTRAQAQLKTAEGKDAGSATIAAADGAITISLDVAGLTQGDHGVHIHMTGRCDAPGFESAGAHWNPAGAKHGLSNPQGQHSGDMPNLSVASDGTAEMEYTIRDVSITDLFDDDGAAIVVHAKADDQMSDPSGNSGDRVACGVLAAA